MESGDERSLLAALEELTGEVRELQLRLKRELSFRYIFLSAIVKGFGYAVGATIVAGILLALLSQTVQRIQNTPFFEDTWGEEVLGAFDVVDEESE